MTADQMISLAATIIAVVAMIVANLELSRALREIDKLSASLASRREEAAASAAARLDRSQASTLARIGDPSAAQLPHPINPWRDS